MSRDEGAGPSIPASFDYSAAAELYPGKTVNKTHRIRYRRFDTAAEALRYAIEEMPAALLRGSTLEVREERYEGVEIRALYDAIDYPLPKPTDSIQ